MKNAVAYFAANHLQSVATATVYQSVPNVLGNEDESGPDERSLLTSSVKHKIHERKLLAQGYFALLRQLAFAFLYVGVLILQANVHSSFLVEGGLDQPLRIWSTNDGLTLDQVMSITDLNNWLGGAFLPNLFFEKTYNGHSVFIPGVDRGRYLNYRLRFAIGVLVVQNMWPDSILREQTPVLWPHPFLDFQMFTETYCANTSTSISATFDPTLVFGTANPCAPMNVTDDGQNLLNLYGSAFLYDSKLDSVSGDHTFEGFHVYFSPYSGLDPTLQQFNFLSTMGYFNNRTQIVEIFATSHSDMLQVSSAFRITFNFDLAGMCTPTVRSVSVSIPYASLNGPWPPWNIFRLFLELLFILSLVYQAYGECQQIKRSYIAGKNKKAVRFDEELYGYDATCARNSFESPPGRLASTKSTRGLNPNVHEIRDHEGVSDYICSIWNLLDWAFILLSVACMAVWLHTTRKVYQVETLRATVRTLPVGELAAKQDLYYVVLAGMLNVSRLQKIYLFVSGINLFLCFIRTLQWFNFHDQLAFLNRTLSHAMRGLFNFLFIFVTLFVAFGAFTHITFGHRMVPFSTLDRALLSCYQAIIEQNTFLDEWEASEGDDPFGVFLAQMFSVLFTVVIVYILINVFLAIVLDAYTSAMKKGDESNQRRRHNQSNFLRDLVTLIATSFRKSRLLRRLDLHLGFAYVPDSIIQQAVEPFLSDKRTVSVPDLVFQLKHLDKDGRWTADEVEEMVEAIFREFGDYVVHDPALIPPPQVPFELRGGDNIGVGAGTGLAARDGHEQEQLCLYREAPGPSQSEGVMPRGVPRPIGTFQNEPESNCRGSKNRTPGAEDCVAAENRVPGGWDSPLEKSPGLAQAVLASEDGVGPTDLFLALPPPQVVLPHNADGDGNGPICRSHSFGERRRKCWQLVADTSVQSVLIGPSGSDPTSESESERRAQETRSNEKGQNQSSSQGKGKGKGKARSVVDDQRMLAATAQPPAPHAIYSILDEESRVRGPLLESQMVEDPRGAGSGVGGVFGHSGAASEGAMGNTERDSTVLGSGDHVQCSQRESGHQGCAKNGAQGESDRGAERVEGASTAPCAGPGPPASAPTPTLGGGVERCAVGTGGSEGPMVVQGESANSGEGERTREEEGERGRAGEGDGARVVRVGTLSGDRGSQADQARGPSSSGSRGGGGGRLGVPRGPGALSVPSRGGGRSFVSVMTGNGDDGATCRLQGAMILEPGPVSESESDSGPSRGP